MTIELKIVSPHHSTIWVKHPEYLDTSGIENITYPLHYVYYDTVTIDENCIIYKWETDLAGSTEKVECDPYIALCKYIRLENQLAGFEMTKIEGRSLWDLSKQIFEGSVRKHYAHL